MEGELIECSEMFCSAAGSRCSSTTQTSPSVVSSSRLVRIEPRHTTTNTSTAYVAAAQKTQTPYLLLATSVGNSVVRQSQMRSRSVADMIQTAGACQVRRSQQSYLIVPTSVGNSRQFLLKSPDNTGMIQTGVTAHSLKSQPPYLILGNSAGNSASSSAANFCQSWSKSAGNMDIIPSTAAHMLSDSASVVSLSSVSSLPVSCLTATSPFLMTNSRSASGLMLQPANVQSSQAPAVLATVLLPAAPLVQIIAGSSAPSPAVQYVLPSPTVQPVSLQSLSNSSQLTNSLSNSVASSSLNCMTHENSEAKSTVMEPSLSGCFPMGNSQPVVIQQSSSDCLSVGSSHSSDIVGIPVSSLVRPLFGNSQTYVVEQPSSYCLPVRNLQSSGIVGIPVSLVSSTLPQLVLLGQSGGQPQPQLLHSSSDVSVSASL